VLGAHWDGAAGQVGDGAHAGVDQGDGDAGAVDARGGQAVGVHLAVEDVVHGVLVVASQCGGRRGEADGAVRGDGGDAVVRAELVDRAHRDSGGDAVDDREVARDVSAHGPDGGCRTVALDDHGGGRDRPGPGGERQCRHGERERTDEDSAPPGQDGHWFSLCA
jgi:hypothetical protein